MIELNIDADIEQFTKWLSRGAKRRLPEALAKALTFTAQDAQAEIQKSIQNRFTNRRKWWVKGAPCGIRIKGADAAQGKFESMVYTEAYFGELQEEGGVKLPYASRGLLIPTPSAPAFGRTAKGAQRLLGQKKILRKGGKASGSAITTMQSGRRGVFRREGKKRLPIQMVYLYRESARVKPRFRFVETASAYGRANFQKKFIRLAEKELRKR